MRDLFFVFLLVTAIILGSMAGGIGLDKIAKKLDARPTMEQLFKK